MGLNIYQKVNEIRKQVAYLRKEKRVAEGGGYMVVTHDQVTGELRDFLVEQNIIVVPQWQSSAISTTGTTTAKGIPFIRYEARYVVEFVNGDEPEQKISVPVEAHAMDTGDKAPGKALSYATKYAMLKLFSIETGEEEEDRPDAKAMKVTPTAGVEERVSKEDQSRAMQVVGTVYDCIEAGMPEEGAKALMESDKNFDVDGKVFIWKQFDSKQRTALRKAMDAMKTKKPEAAHAH